MDRKKWEIIIAILVLAGLVILLFFILRNPVEPTTTPNDQQQADRPPVERVTQVDSRTVESPADVIARTFVERLGSYSTDVDYANVDDVKALVTSAMSGELDRLVASVSGQQTGYYGVSTKVISLKTVSSDDSSTTIDMTTQRKESFDTPANTSVRYQGITVELTKSGNRWLVSDYTWDQ